MAWLDAHQPQDVGACVIHNDWRFDNVVLDPGDLSQIRAVLDWELATVGDPFMDLGSALAYWVQSDDDAGMQAFRMQPSNAPGMPSREEFVQRYCELAADRGPTGCSTRFSVCSGWRASPSRSGTGTAMGQTSNPAFAPFGPAVVYLISRCERLIAQA